MQCKARPVPSTGVDLTAVDCNVSILREDHHMICWVLEIFEISCCETALRDFLIQKLERPAERPPVLKPLRKAKAYGKTVLGYEQDLNCMLSLQGHSSSPVAAAEPMQAAMEKLDSYPTL